MRTDTPDDASLDAALAALRRPVSPSRDLWPTILARLAARRTVPRWPLALAAGLAIVAVTALVTTRVIDARHAATPALADAGGGGQRQAAMDANAKLAATRSELRRSFEERLLLLAPPTRAAVLHSLATIQQAHDELESALQHDPGSTLVRELLDTTRHEEYALYEDVVRSTDTLAQRT